MTGNTLIRICAWLVRFYPAEYRAWFADEMARVLREAAAERYLRGNAALLHFVVTELVGLTLGIGVEWTARLRHSGRYCASQVASQQLGPRLPDFVMEAQTEVEFLVGKLVHAIANHQFDKARFYAAEECKARQDLRTLLESYGIDEAPAA